MSANPRPPDWLRDYLAATRQEVWNDSQENEAFEEMLRSILDIMCVPSRDSIGLTTIRTTSFAIERLSTRSSLHIIFDLSLMEIFEHLTRLALSGLTVRQMLAPLSPIFANRLAAGGRPGLTNVAVYGSLRRAARLPATSAAEDSSIHMTSRLQGVFAFLHEVGHIARSASAIHIRPERLLTLDVWADLLSPYRERVEGSLTSGSLRWLDSLPEVARGALPDEVLTLITDHHREKFVKMDDDLICNWPITKVLDYILQNPSSALAEEVLCDAQAMWTLSMLHNGSSLGDRVTAAIMAGQNLHLLRRLERDGVRSPPDASAASDSLVRTRLLTLFGQSLLWAHADLSEEQNGTPQNAAVDETLRLHDSLHDRMDHLASAIDLWPYVNLTALEQGLLDDGFVPGLPRETETVIELLHPRGRFRLSAPNVDNEPGIDPTAISSDLAHVVNDRMPSGTDLGVSTTTIALLEMAGTDYEDLRSNIARYLLAHEDAFYRPLASVAAAALSAAIGGLAHSPEVRPFALASVNGRTALDFMHPIEDGTTHELLDRLTHRLIDQVRRFDVVALVCRGQAGPDRPDAVIVQVSRPNELGAPCLLVIAEYSVNAFARRPQVTKLITHLLPPD